MKRKRDEESGNSEVLSIENPAKRVRQPKGFSTLPAVLQRLAATFLDLTDHHMLARCSKNLTSICAHGTSFAGTIDLTGLHSVYVSPGFLKLLTSLGQWKPRKKFIMDLDMAWWQRDLDLSVDEVHVVPDDYVDDDVPIMGDGLGRKKLIQQLNEWQPRDPIRVLHWEKYLSVKVLPRALRHQAFRDLQELHLYLLDDEGGARFKLETLQSLHRLTTLYLTLSFTEPYKLKPLLNVTSLTALHLQINGRGHLPPELHELPVVSLSCSVLAFTAPHVRGPISCSTLTIVSNEPLDDVVETFDSLMPKLQSLAIKCTSIHRESSFTFSWHWLRALKKLKLDSLTVDLPGFLQSTETESLPPSLRKLDIKRCDVETLDHLTNLEELTLRECTIPNIERLASGLAPSMRRFCAIECTRPFTIDHVPDSLLGLEHVSVEDGGAALPP